MEERLITQLDECLAAIEAGESVPACLGRYADETGELAALLHIALALEALPQAEPAAGTVRAARASFLNEARRRRRTIEPRPTSAWEQISRLFFALSRSTPARALATTAVALALVLLLGSSMIYAAADSLPGDSLYGFKRLGEDIQYTLTFGHDKRIRLEEAFSARRRDEVRQLLAQRRQQEVTFGGLLRAKSGNDWWVEDIAVTIDAHTRTQADPKLNTFVEIHGLTQANGTVLARLVEIEGDEIIGLIEDINPSEWQIDGQCIHVDDQSHVQKELQVGDCVEAHTRILSDGTLLALEIERSEGCQDKDTP